MKKISVILAITFAVILTSCGRNDYKDTSYLPVVQDEAELLSPRSEAFFKNYQFPRGIVPVLYTVDSIPAMETGICANELFDQIADESPDENAFRQAGLLVLVSRSPELIQVRVGSGYASFFSMKGVTAGYGYLKMQQRIKDDGLEGALPLFVDCISEEVNQYRNLSWWQKIRVKNGIGFIHEFLSDCGTPSDSFLNKVYFRPALCLLTWVHGMVHNWFISLLIILVMIWGLKYWIESLSQKKILQRVSEDKDDLDNRVFNNVISFAAGSWIGKVFAAFATFPVLASLTMLSNTRMEDYLVMKSFEVPFVDMIDWSDRFNNVAAPIWLIGILAVVFYIYYMLSADGGLVMAFLPPKVQTMMLDQSETSRNLCDSLLRGGIVRQHILSHLISSADYDSAPSQDDNAEDADLDSRDLLNAMFFHTKNSPLYKAAPLTAIYTNYHREMLFYVSLLIIGISLLCPTPVVFFFVAVFAVSALVRIHKSYTGIKRMKLPWSTHFAPGMSEFFLSKDKLLSYAYFIILLALISFMNPLKEVEVKDTIETAVVRTYQLEGPYFVEQSGSNLNMAGATAKIEKIDAQNYQLSVFSRYPTKVYDLQYDERTYLFTSAQLGEGSVEYNKDIDKITVKFTSGWVFTK